MNLEAVVVCIHDRCSDVAVVAQLQTHHTCCVVACGDQKLECAKNDGCFRGTSQHTVVASVVRSAQMHVDIAENLTGARVVHAHESESVKRTEINSGNGFTRARTYAAVSRARVRCSSTRSKELSHVVCVCVVEVVRAHQRLYRLKAEN